MRLEVSRRASSRARVAVLVALALILTSVGTAEAVSAPNIYTIAGTGSAGDSGEGGQATEAEVSLPRSIFPTADGGYLFSQPYDHAVRRVSADGILTTVAGTGVSGFSGDGGPARDATVNFVHGASPAPDGGFLIADTLNHRIRRVSPGGIITTVAGTGARGYSGDGGPATSAAIQTARGVVALADGGFLFPDSDNHRIRRVSPGGIITTVAGRGARGFSGDGGLATAARLARPFGVAPTADGGFLIADTDNHRIRRVSPGGIITTVAGTGAAGYAGDGGPAASAPLSSPHNVVATSDGGFVIADTQNHRVRLVTGGTITTLAGTGAAAYGGDGGPAASGALNRPKAVAVSPVGAVLIADESNNRIRFVGVPVAPENATPPAIIGEARQGETLAGIAGGWTGTGPTIAYQWRRCDAGDAACTDIAGATGRAYIVGPADVGSTVRLLVTASNAAGAASSVSAPTTTVTGSSPQPSLAVSDASVTEGPPGTTATATFTASLSAASTGTVSADFASTDGSAVAGLDYVANSGRLTFEPGELTKTVEVVVTGDGEAEAAETFSLSLSNPSGASISDGTATGTIVDDDGAPEPGPRSLSIAGASVSEGDTGTTTAVFTVSLSSVSTQTVRVKYRTTGATATSGQDFQSASGTLSFAPGQTTATIAVAVVGDALDEDDEAFTVELAQASGAELAGRSATGTIVDDD